MTRPCLPSRVRVGYQRGQALIYGLFLLIGSLAGLFFLFNTGQLASEKTRLVNTADAVAYSAAVLHARALNFDAYNNRALIANEVLVAQMVSLSSWAQYAKLHVENVPVVFPECMDPNGAGAALGALNNYGVDYAAMCYAIAQPEFPVRKAIETLGEIVPPATSAAVTAIEANKKLIGAAQAFLHADLIFTQARKTLLQDVADRNYAGAGNVTVVAGGLGGGAPGAAPADDWNGFTQKYTGTDRARLADATGTAASKDRFVHERAWKSAAVLPLGNGFCFTHRNSVKRAGGTDLIGLDEWKSEDTESFWSWHAHGFIFKHCKEEETPIAWGEQRVFIDGGEQDASDAPLGGSPATNPSAHSFASSAEWTNYSGLPAFYDLSPTALGSSDPRLAFAVKIVRNAADAATSAGTSGVKASPRLNHFPSNFAGGVMSAISTGEVYFERPWFNSGDHSYTTGDTTYIVTQNQSVPHDKGDPKVRELGSLFNPYWQVHLTSNQADSITKQQMAQGGAVMP